MSEDTPPPNPLDRRRRVEFAPMALPFTGGQGKAIVFLIIVAVCFAAAAYMYFIQHMPWSDMRVIAPAIGGLWFALRLFMTLTPKT